MIRKILASLVLSLLIATPVFAGNQPFTYQQIAWRDSPPYDASCFEEDDGAEWQGYGRVQSGFTLTQVLTFCETVGGSGFQFILLTGGSFTVDIVSPTGLHWPLTISKLKGDKLTYACVGDDHGILDGLKTGTIETGDWTINLIYLGSHATLVDRLSVEVGQTIGNANSPPTGCVF